MKDKYFKKMPKSLKLKIGAYFMLLGILEYAIFKNNALILIIAILGIGTLYAHGIELLHELLHLQKTTSRRIIGFFLGFPMLISYAHYRANHLHHHVYLGTDKDEEFFSYDRRMSLSAFLLSLLMLTQFKKTFKHIYYSFKKINKDNKLTIHTLEVEKSINTEYQLMALGMLIFLLVGVFVNIKIILLGWVIPLMFVAAPLHVLIELPEHFGCDKNSNIFENTRTISTNSFVRWLVNGNNLHVEHHYKSNLTIYECTILNKELTNKIKYKNSSYFEFYKNFFKHVCLNNKNSEVIHE